MLSGFELYSRWVPLSSLPDNLHRHASDSGIDLPNMTQFQSSKETKYPIKRLTVKRPSNSGFGFSIRGGAEHGVGLYVSSVDEKSVAEKRVFYRVTMLFRSIEQDLTG